MPRHLIPFAFVVAALAAGCSAPSTTDSPAAAPPSATGPAAAPAPAAAGRAIEITANDTMKFSVTEIAAKPGEPLTVTLVNVGTTPKFSMGHNWVLLTPGTDAQAFVVAAADAVTTDYVPAAEKAKIVASTRLLGPKERDAVTFTAPTTPGRYEFVCSFPGHFQVGMRGVLIVG
jgi:azurin